jgi:hypothetical protein
MHRRDFLWHLAACGALCGVPLLDPGTAMSASGAFIFITDGPRGLPAAARSLRIAADGMLDPAWHVDAPVHRILAALGGANAVLMMESLRDRRAAIEYAGSDAAVAAALVGLPSATFADAAAEKLQFIVATLRAVT